MNSLCCEAGKLCLRIEDSVDNKMELYIKHILEKALD